MNLLARTAHQPSLLYRRRAYPQVIKYMGSKARILDFVLEGLNSASNGGPVCDLFAGACSLSGAVGNQTNLISNDIQNYSKAIAHLYLQPMSERAKSLDIDALCDTIQIKADAVVQELGPGFEYIANPSLDGFNAIEAESRSLISREFSHEYHLFVKNYSGTWWSADQCAWIDAARETLDGLRARCGIDDGDHSILLTCVMHAMAYCGQGTGHYAQYRDAKSQSSMLDINIYRQKSIATQFRRKLKAVREWNVECVPEGFDHKYLAVDYRDCLAQLNEATIYADPPYAFVHYSRFYHAIETFVLYDYPQLQIKGGSVVKGRYRQERHQSPFSIRSQVPSAFEAMFAGTIKSGSNLALSYSNSALLALPAIAEIAADVFGSGYSIEVITTDHQHMTMGRRADRLREVEEAILIAKRR